AAPAPPEGPAAPQPPTAPAPPPAPEPDGDIVVVRRVLRPVVRVGVPYTLAAGQEVGEVTVVLGDATIDGVVDRELVVVMGDVRLGNAAVVQRAVVVGGRLTVADGARIERDLAVVGGQVDAPAGFAPGGEHVVVGPPLLGAAMRAVVPWI